VLHRTIDHQGGSFDKHIYFNKMLPGGMYYLKVIHENEEYSQSIFVE